MFDSDTSEEENDSSASSKSEDKTIEESDDLVPKKRGPKKRLTKRPQITSFKLCNSGASSSDSFDDNINEDKLKVPWVEKYRPRTLNDLTVDKMLHDTIKKILDDKIMPNLIITGLPGIGKTTTMLIIAKTIAGNHFKDTVLELNASDERGVKTVHNTIEKHCKLQMPYDGSVKHKLVLLDEADNMTTKAQQTITKLIDEYKNNTRFVFTCNDSTKITQAIQSRCTILRFKRLTDQQIKARLKQICEQENVNYTDPGLQAIIIASQGDLRHSISNLELIYNGYTNITSENVYNLCDKPAPFIIENIFIACEKKDIKTALKLLNDLSNNGYSSCDITFNMFNTLKKLNNNVISEENKIRYMEEICKTSFVISKGVNTPLQLNGAIAKLCL